MTIISLLLALNAHADLGPKPTMHFAWMGKDKVDTTTVYLHQCEDKACSKSKPLKQLGPQHFFCTETFCEGQAYGFSEFNQLVGKTEDGKEARSNVFRTVGMESKYLVTAKGTKIKVEAKK